ncbi:MAG: cell envelope integrity protein TolA, partial [Gammaproteobacteria bacterium]|nr:cell envelope integrity protein TolA [Gammaproteobacteria bacterium]
HIVIVIILVVSFKWSDKPTLPSIDRGEEIVNAVAVDGKQIEKELKKIKAAETRRQRELEREIKRAEKARKKEEKKLADTKRQRLQESKLAEQQRKQEQEKIKSEQNKLKQVQDQSKKEQEKIKQEEERLKAIAEKRKKEEAELEKLEQEKRDAEMRKRLEAEQKELAQETTKQQQTVINQYRALIEAKVRQNWIVPAGAKEGMSCELLVRLIPSGDVISVQLTKSSGDSVFDRSVENAIRKASPLPVPSAETGLFDVFRDLRFPFVLEKKS